ncbi:sugar O-acyltransferase, sialic acid O-acetyltransferase NeuD family [Thermovirga lienii DSM 17291]|uniref:Sugar O-acyltransferase, sialic acid O-acetyltransferase NeuD family n=1 Tax=Thermovirga lienii (strain ATCC BAA-1197 / DSM 17291 / Cas60314) TaxID=580340 RepID=G7V8Z2_THELD|nr:acetyltransferase [Thermovirga lienii]AER67526.1 sugar O-acyltransferase, sialic acid O-acetyltransferase NeuD family [Thermovirga lienii DSM 17291]
MEKKPLVIIGAGGLGREVAWLVEDINRKEKVWEFIGFIDDFKEGFTPEGYPIIGKTEDLYDMREKLHLALAVADASIRKRLACELKGAGFEFATLIHPSAMMSRHVRIGEGSIICAGSIITTNVVLGSFCIVNPGCFIGHDTVLSDFVSLMPGVNVAGDVRIGEGAYLGLSACVINMRSIGDGSIIGGGAAVVHDIPSRVVAVGVPARVIKNLNL